MRRFATGAAGRMPARVRRGPLSLRARLLAGLIALTAMFLIVMGVVSTVVLGRLEQNQFNAEVSLAARQSIMEIHAGGDSFAAAYLSTDSGSTGELTPDSQTANELLAVLRTMAHEPSAQVYARLAKMAATDKPFTVTPDGQPPVRAAWRAVPASSTSTSGGIMPPGPGVILVGRAASQLQSNKGGLVLAEIITGCGLIALLVICGTWLIDRALAPLRRMASTADMITTSGDLASRMPDAGHEQETGLLAAAINTMLDQIQQSFSARLRSEQKVRQFAADASHELRTPLTTIRGYAELYRANALGPDELPNAMRRIEQEAERMSMLVAELLELARLDRSSSLDLSETDLTVLARDAIADARAVEPDRPVSARLPDSLVVTADEPRVRQVLANLLGNVRAHTPPGTPATVAVYATGNRAVLEVSDAGPGMPADDAARAFDRFYRGVRTAVTTGAAGRGHDGAYYGSEAASSGLGLSIVQAIATAHGGQAELHAAPGEGTTVLVWIPLRDHEGDPGLPDLQDAEFDADVAAGRPGVRADLVSRLGELADLLPLHAGHVHDQRHHQAECVAIWADADLRGHR